MIKDIVFNFLDYIEEKFHFISKDLQLVMCYTTYLDFYTEVGYDYPIQLGYDDNKKIDSSKYSYHKNIWIDTMESYFKDHEASWYDIPDNVVGVLVNPITGTLV